MIIPYIVMFSVASIVSLLAIGVKFMLIHQKIQARKDADPDARKTRRPTVGGIQVAPELLRNQSVHELKEKFDDYKIERWSHILNVLVAIFE